MDFKSPKKHWYSQTIINTLTEASTEEPEVYIITDNIYDEKEYDKLKEYNKLLLKKRLVFSRDGQIEGVEDIQQEKLEVIPFPEESQGYERSDCFNLKY